MDKQVQILYQILQENKLSITKQRLAVFRTLLTQHPLSMKDIISKTANIDRASIYRTIDLFLEYGIVSKIPIGFKYKIELSERFLSHHHHFYCLACGKSLEIKSAQLIDQSIEKVAVLNNFIVSDHNVELRGRCDSCATKQQ